MATSFVDAAVLVLALVFLATSSEAVVCGNRPVYWRYNNVTCSPRVVCADVFESRRNWYNGTTCKERRVLSNCLCPGNRVCPTDNDNHKLYSTSTHVQYTCEPACNFAWCQGVNLETGRMGQPTRPTAMTTLQRVPAFGYRTFNRIDCRCPLHHFPLSRRAGRLFRAVQAASGRWDPRGRYQSTFYACRNYRNSAQNQIADPCA